MFLRSVFFKSRFVDCKSLDDICQNLEIPRTEAIFYKNGRKLNHEENDLGSDDVLEVVLGHGLVGGKGGFGSMLRALGNQIQKTTNKEAMRDLSGRRMRDINEEKRIKNFVSKRADREREKKEAKEAKLKKLHKLVTPGESKHEFSDKNYDEAREAATDRVQEAIEDVFNNPDLKPSVSSGLKRKVDQDEMVEKKKAKKEQEIKPGGKAKDLWIGVDLNDSDLEDSSDDEESSSKGSSSGSA